ncbi:hypothetical protein [Brevundimonas sp. A19_0]|uniref:hypothetical protein n=1 Tax=Brevundimonas sp. A19_0 TaxID=2821087 RepID=UPI001ADC8B4F|nr:hypothetical protein [Brevundimonas sp. A19_0]MBO9502510.1 hypothetical protein [Brevundimonas sp. A19_0]
MTDTLGAGAPQDPVNTPPVANRPAPVPRDPDLDRIDREYRHMMPSRGLAASVLFEGAQLTGRTLDYIQMDDQRRFESHLRMTTTGGELLDRETADERYGIRGRLSFDGPVSEAVAAWRYSVASREAFAENVTANDDLGPLTSLGITLSGTILDPAAAPLWLVPEVAAGRVLRAGTVGQRLAGLGPVARGAVIGAGEGLAGGVLYEAVNLGLSHAEGTDYDFGDASASLLLGTVLGGVLGAGAGWWEGRTPRAPAMVEALEPEARLGAFHQALEAVSEDRPVDLASMLVRQGEVMDTGRRSPAQMQGLDEVAFEPFGGARLLQADVAVTTTGREIPVRYALFEASDLITSHDDDMFANPAFPAALQPRNRGERAGSKAYNVGLESRMNPKRLVRDVGAETGAPIVSPDGVVESGNGRTIALRRALKTDGPLAKAYRAELEALGLPLEGYQQPVLVRMRSEPLTGADRVRLTREMNEAPTEALSASERAMADAEAVDGAVLEKLASSDLNAAGNRTFVRAFLDKVAGTDLNRLVTKTGELSEAGLQRARAALVAKAYEDRQLVEALFESEDSHVRAIGKALVEAAPEWTTMKAAMARGDIPAELDLTEPLRAAVAFVRQVRAARGNVGEAMELIVDQTDAFSGRAMTVETEAFVRAFFRTDKETRMTLWRSPRSAASLGEGLRFLATEAMKVQPGPNLFGEVADRGTARELLDGLGRWFARQGDDGSAPDLFGLGDGPDGAPRPAGGNVRPAGDPAGREPGGQGAGGQAEGLATAVLEKPRIPKGEPAPPPPADPFADPELAALRDDTEAWEATLGIEPPAYEPGRDPQSLADAVTAASLCLLSGGEG